MDYALKYIFVSHQGSSNSRNIILTPKSAPNIELQNPNSTITCSLHGVGIPRPIGLYRSQIFKFLVVLVRPRPSVCIFSWSWSGSIRKFIFCIDPSAFENIWSWSRLVRFLTFSVPVRDDSRCLFPALLVYRFQWKISKFFLGSNRSVRDQSVLARGSLIPCLVTK